MWTSITLWIRPVWNVADYSVGATWKDSEDAEGIPLVREGTLQITTDDGPVEILRRLVEVLERSQDQAESYAPRRT